MKDRGYDQQERLRFEIHDLYVFDMPMNKTMRLAQFDLGVHNGYTMTAYIETESDGGTFYWNGVRFIELETNEVLYPRYDEIRLRKTETRRKESNIFKGMKGDTNG